MYLVSALSCHFISGAGIWKEGLAHAQLRQRSANRNKQINNNPIEVGISNKKKNWEYHALFKVFVRLYKYLLLQKASMILRDSERLHFTGILGGNYHTISYVHGRRHFLLVIRWELLFIAALCFIKIVAVVVRFCVDRHFRRRLALLAQ